MSRPKSRPFLGDNNGDVTDEMANDGAFLEVYSVLTKENVRFKAFVKSFSDSFEPSWNEDELYGRMDPIGVYKRTKRSISITVGIPAVSLEEAKNNMLRFSRLVSMLYPTYDSLEGGAGTISGSPLVKVKFMNLIFDAGAGSSVGSAEEAGLLVRVTSPIALAPNVDQGFFRDTLYDIFPKEFEITIAGTVLHQHHLGWDGPNRRGQFAQFPYGEDLDEGEADETDVALDDQPTGSSTTEGAEDDATSRSTAVNENEVLGNE